VEPGLGGKPSTPTCGWPCATISAASTPSGPEAVAGGAYGRMIFNTTFGDPVPDGARALHLYAVPVKSVFTHSAPTRCRRTSPSPDRAGAVPRLTPTTAERADTGLHYHRGRVVKVSRLAGDGHPAGLHLELHPHRSSLEGFNSWVDGRFWLRRARGEGAPNTSSSTVSSAGATRSSGAATETSRQRRTISPPRRSSPTPRRPAFPPPPLLRLQAVLPGALSTAGHQASQAH
jgi:hypothetical protein